MSAVGSASKWEPVRQLVAHLAVDDELMLAWVLKRHGDLRSPLLRERAVHGAREELVHLIRALDDRIAGAHEDHKA